MLHFTQREPPTPTVTVVWDDMFQEWVLKEDFPGSMLDENLRAGRPIARIIVHILEHGCTIVPEKMVECGWCKNSTDFKGLNNLKGHLLCNDCKDKFKDKTDYCGLTCCMTGKCDGNC